MDKAAGWQVIDQQRTSLAALLDTLTSDEWETPSLCTGWTARDVAAHLSIGALMPMRDVMASTVRARGSFNRMIHDSAVERAAARTTTDIVADLRSIIGSSRLAPTTFWRDPLLDLLVHTQDIVRPLGRHVPMPSDAAAEAIGWVWRRRFPFFPARRFRGIAMVADDVDWRAGDGPELRGPVSSLLLLCTGRLGVLGELRGPGLDRLAQRPVHRRSIEDGAETTDDRTWS